MTDPLAPRVIRPVEDESRQGYVVGFLIDPDRDMVLLIRKNRPAWQAGKLNGIGGHIEETDRSAFDAMRREFEEETGLVVMNWKLMVSMFFPGAYIHFFRAIGDRYMFSRARTQTDEDVDEYVIGRVLTHDHVKSNMVPNLRWLLPLAAYTVDNYEPMICHAAISTLRARP